MPRVAVVDDHELIAETVRMAVTGSGVDAFTVTPRPLPDLLAALLEAQPDLVLLDLDLPPFGDSTELIAPLTQGGIRVLLVTGTAERLRIAAALAAGAVGYHPKSQGVAALLARSHAALTCAEPLDLAERARLLDDLVKARTEYDRAYAPFRSLTERELDTLEALSRGLSVTQIANAWVVSPSTVRSHVRGILTKLNAPSQLAAVTQAADTGWFAERSRIKRT